MLFIPVTLSKPKGVWNGSSFLSPFNYHSIIGIVLRTDNVIKSFGVVARSPTYYNSFHKFPPSNPYRFRL
ncbi:hypothetical protein QVD17_04307 [Tagetes erecta]|uniref:Uncharacterized protein n=1 Tax=Tagetes erecta TaxID=13708 RepID=A0AAD8P9N0_TARER|nr:hypothetical protein QVD17_04307 [Tagetes erecta]